MRRLANGCAVALRAARTSTIDQADSVLASGAAIKNVLVFERR